MQWKEIVIGSVATLIVTVVAGVGTYYLTKEPDYAKVERLLYSVEQLAEFRGNSKNASMTYVSFKNSGGAAARDVTLGINLSNSKFEDYSVTNSQRVPISKESVKDGSAEFKLERLLPGESIKISFLQSLPENPSVTLRSSESVGKEDEPAEPKASRASSINTFIKYFVPFIGVFTIAASIFLARLLSRSRRQRPHCRNNVGFLLLHQGMVEDATRILRLAVENGEDGPHALANLALCEAMHGDAEKSNSYLNAAEYYASDDQEKSLVELSRAISFLISGNKAEFYSRLKQAISLEAKEIREYCNYSVHLDEVRAEKTFQELMSDA